MVDEAGRERCESPPVVKLVAAARHGARMRQHLACASGCALGHQSIPIQKPMPIRIKDMTITTRSILSHPGMRGSVMAVTYVSE
jgi:hypothetical protein